MDYLSPGKTKIPGITNLVFRTHVELEHSKLIFQMGTANPDIAVQAASMIINDVSGVDVNAGCPKHFSIHAGMGAALLKTPDLLCSILTNLVQKVGEPNDKPISVKIRLMPEQEDSLSLVKRLVKTGIANLTLHCRTQNMRNREAPIHDYVSKIKDICDEAGVNFIINGAVIDREDFLRLQRQFGEDCGGMIAEKAEINPTVFSLTPLAWIPLVKEYLQLAERVDNFFGNTKFMITRMVPGKHEFYRIVAKAKSYDDVKQMLKELDAKNESEVPKDESKKHALEPLPLSTPKKQQLTSV